MKVTDNELARAAQRGDRQASNELFRRLVPLVKHVAFRYVGLDRDELFQAGSLGFMHALRTWRPKRSAFKTWMVWWIRAYAGRARKMYAKRAQLELPMVLPGLRGDDGEPMEGDHGDDGACADEMTDGLWRRQAHGLIDGMADRRYSVVLKGRMRGETLEEIAEGNRKVLGIKSNGREWVRQLEQRGLEKAAKLARASA